MFYRCRALVVVCTVEECSYCGFEDSCLLQQKSMSFSRNSEVREAGERERVLSRDYERSINTA